MLLPTVRKSFVLIVAAAAIFACGSDAMAMESTTAQAEATTTPEVECTAFDAEYVPPGNAKSHSKFTYKITVTEGSKVDPVTGPFAFLKIHTYRRSDGAALSTLTIPYVCMMDGDCHLSLDSSPKCLSNLEVIGLRKDLSSASIKFGRAPDMLIIPDIHHALRALDWERENRIEYHLDDLKPSLRPSYLIPSRWILSTCTKQGGHNEKGTNERP